ncbi:hypothetical protein NPIL_128151 [Nephila pilipes]|uniref:Uncharacterized protein n=1 Tax=Nephila pilipes TaxID=299642 RepID=A0A8X6IDB3_NEPPI|nr:hypothetical protein NPIL_128151 [Nephila pilipes]
MISSSFQIRLMNSRINLISLPCSSGLSSCRQTTESMHFSTYSEGLLLVVAPPSSTLIEIPLNVSRMGSTTRTWARQWVSACRKISRQSREIASTISTSMLASWQRLDALKKLFPSLCHAMVMAQFGKSDWSAVNKAILKEVKEILGLPDNASNHYGGEAEKFGAAESRLLPWTPIFA